VHWQQWIRGHDRAVAILTCGACACGTGGGAPAGRVGGGGGGGVGSASGGGGGAERGGRGGAAVLDEPVITHCELQVTLTHITLFM
jgi:hypothetical protein